MEVVGLVAGIIDLYSACQRCYDLFSDVKNAGEHTALAARELYIHSSILKAWAFYWEIKLPISPTNGTEDLDGAALGNKQIMTSPKLSKYLDRNPCKSVGIATALLCIGDLLSDKRKLLHSYGLEVNFEDSNGAMGVSAPTTSTWKQLVADVEEKTHLISSRINLKRRFAWALKDQAKFKVLIAELKKHNDSLHLLGPEWAFEMLNISLVLEYLPRQDDSWIRQLQQFARNKASTGGSNTANSESTEPGDETESNGDGPSLSSPVSPTQQGLRLLFDLAKIKGEAFQSARETYLGREEEKKLLLFRESDFQFGDSGMAVWLRGKETVFIEKHFYETPDGDEALSRRIRTNILKLGRLLQLPVCRKRLCALELLGLFQFHWGKAIGFVYRLPGSLEKHKKGFPIYDMEIRRPRGVAMIRQGEPIPPLGLRYELARTLVQSVAFLHASGWLHKNIRTTEFVVFPKDRSVISRDPEGMNLEQPFLIGYRFSRPDEVREDVAGDLLRLVPAGQDGSTSPLPQMFIQRTYKRRLVHRPKKSGSRYDSDGYHGDPAQHHPGEDENPTYLPGEATDNLRPRIPANERESVNFAPEDGAKISEGDSFESSSSTSSNADQNIVPMRGNDVFITDSRLSSEPFRANLDEFHHPSKRLCPNRRYCHAFDVYSLGIALVEIGLWDRSSFRSNGDVFDPFADTRIMKQRARWALPSACGEIYTSVALACLAVDPEGEGDADEGAGLLEQRELCARIAADLAQCRA